MRQKLGAALAFLYYVVLIETLWLGLMLLLTIRDQKVMHRRILVYLTRREGQAFSENDLARYLGYSRTSITHSYPNDLVNRGLIRRGLTVDKLQYTFQSTVREKLAELCPDLEIEPLVERINKLERV